jgi:hypothetical protein
MITFHFQCSHKIHGKVNLMLNLKLHCRNIEIEQIKHKVRKIT